ncbi:hypothetical protein Tco_1218059 [Tanacetum coccineum]
MTPHPHLILKKDKIKPRSIIFTKNHTQVFSVHNWALKPNQTEGPPFTDHMKAICNLDVPVDSKASKPSSETEKVPQGKKPGAKSGLRRKQSSKYTYESKTEASKSKTGQSEKETYFFHLHSESASGHDASANFTDEAYPGLYAPNDSIPAQQDKSEEEEEVAKDKDTHVSSHDEPEDTSIPHPPSLKLAQIQELMAQARPSYQDINQLTDLLVTSLKPEFSKLLALHNFASCLPNALKELPSKFTELSGEIKELKKHVQDMEIELPEDLKEIPTKLETFTSTISSLSSQEKLKTLDSLPSLLNKVIDTLNGFSTVVENASRATTKGVPSAGQATASPVEGEKNTNPATTDAEPNLHDVLVDLLWFILGQLICHSIPVVVLPTTGYNSLIHINKELNIEKYKLCY